MTYWSVNDFPQVKNRDKKSGNDLLEYVFRREPKLGRLFWIGLIVFGVLPIVLMIVLWSKGFVPAEGWKLWGLIAGVGGASFFAFQFVWINKYMLPAVERLEPEFDKMLKEQFQKME